MSPDEVTAWTAAGGALVGLVATVGGLLVTIRRLFPPEVARLRRRVRRQGDRIDQLERLLREGGQSVPAWPHRRGKRKTRDRDLDREWEA